MAVSILAAGKIGYIVAARQAIKALLARTDFDIHVTTDAAGEHFIPRSARVHIYVADMQPEWRADLFLGKFVALENCLSHSSDDLVLALDADTVVLHELYEADVVEAIGSHDLGMVEQTTILGTSMHRREFLDHYSRVSLGFLLPEAAPPAEADFTYFNSGVILARRAGLREFLDWAATLRASRPAHHQVGEHMIADQDYFQVWSNTVRPGRTAVLLWGWNHCDKWDVGFVRDGAHIAHFSNFCLGPELSSSIEMHRLAGGAQMRGAAQQASTELAIVVVTYNSAGTIAFCLDAVLELGYPVIVVDNASADDTLAHCAVPGVQVIRNATNTGFGAAANQGARAANATTVCFLNPDCLLTQEAVDAALSCLARRPESLAVPDMVGWEGGRQAGRQPAYSDVRLVADIVDTNGLPRLAQRLYAIAESRRPNWYWPIGACVFVGRERFLELGGFDARYFCYMEDVQLGLDIYSRGGEVLALPVSVAHFGSLGAAVSPERRRQLLTTARIGYARFNHSAFLAVGLFALDASLRFLRRARRWAIDLVPLRWRVQQ